MSIKQGENGYDLLFNSMARNRIMLSYGNEITDEMLNKVVIVDISLPVDEKELSALKQCPEIALVRIDGGETLDNKGRKVTLSLEEKDVDDLIKSMNIIKKYINTDPDIFSNFAIYLDQQDKPLSKETYTKLGKYLNQIGCGYKVCVKYKTPSVSGTFYLDGDDKRFLRVSVGSSKEQDMPAGILDNAVFFDGVKGMSFYGCSLTIKEVPKSLEKLNISVCDVDLSQMGKNNLLELETSFIKDLKTGKDLQMVDVLQNKNLCEIDYIECFNDVKDGEKLSLDKAVDFSKIDTVLSNIKELAFVCDENVDFEKISKIFPNLESVKLFVETPTLVSLKGIENCKNLKKFNCTDKNCLLQDFDNLSKVESLTEIDMQSQQLIKSFDVSQLKNLERLSLSGSTIQEIKGLDKLQPTLQTRIFLHKCFNLQKVVGLDAFLQKAADNPKILDYVINLDSVFYQKYMAETVDGKHIHEDVEQALLEEWQTKNNKSCIAINPEYSSGSTIQHSSNPLQMRVQRKYIDYILTKQCKIEENDDDWTKAKKAYDWITQNLHYAHGMLSFEKRNTNYDSKFFGNEGYDHLYVATPYFALLKRYDIKPVDELTRPTKEDKERGWGQDKEKTHYNHKYDKKGHLTKTEIEYIPQDRQHYSVCEGIANLYVEMLQSMGIEAYESAIEWEDLTAHAIVRAKVDGKYYYFDPTWDLGKKFYSHFGNNKEQAEQRHANSSVDSSSGVEHYGIVPKWRYSEDKESNVSESKQSYLSSRGLLKREDMKQEEMDIFNQAMLTDLACQTSIGIAGAMLKTFKRSKKFLNRNIKKAKEVMDKVENSGLERPEDVMECVGEFCEKMEPGIKKLGKDKNIKYHQVENSYEDVIKKQLYLEEIKEKMQEENEQKIEEQQKAENNVSKDNENVESKDIKAVEKEKIEDKKITKTKTIQKESGPSFGMQ